MKPFFLALLFLVFSITLPAQCDWDKNLGKDPFTGIFSRGTNWENIVRSASGSISFKIIEYPQDSTISLFVKVSVPINPIRCFDENSQILLKSGVKVITLDFLLGDIDCGSILVNFCELLPEDLAFLRKNPIDMLRIDFAEGYKDFTILKAGKRQNDYDLNKANYFIRTLKCFD